MIQVLVQSDAISGSYTSSESTTESIGGSDGFTMTETQCETLDSSGTITWGGDHYAYNDTGTDTFGDSEQGSDTVAAGGVNDGDTSGGNGSGVGGHSEQVSGADKIYTGGFVGYGTNCFTYTWGGSESESRTSSETHSDVVTAGGDGRTDWSTILESTSDSASEGQTGTLTYENAEGTNWFDATQWVNYTDNDQDSGWDQRSETGGESDSNADGGDAGQQGETFSATDTGGGQGTFHDTLTIYPGTQWLSDSLIVYGNSPFTWIDHGSLSDTDVATSTESSSGSESGSEIDGGSSSSYFEGDTATDGETDATTESLTEGETDNGTEALTSYGLVTHGSETVDSSSSPTIDSTDQQAGGDTVTDIATATDDAGGGVATQWSSSVENDQDTSGESEDFDVLVGARG